MSDDFVSIIIPTYNEEAFIEAAIIGLIDQLPLEYYEILVADGMSMDQTRIKLQALIEKKVPIRIIDNPRRLQVFGLNAGLREAKGNYIIRADAHSLFPRDYVRRCVHLLRTTEAANVGGAMIPQGLTPTQIAISYAMSHPLGVGNAKFHLGKYSGFVDTVYLGAFRKSLFEEIGPYDEKCITNEDAELNIRILNAGKKIYLDSSLRVTYFPRCTLRALARQYFRYGQGRCYTTLKHRKFASWRQLAPVGLVVTLASTTLLGFIWPILFLADCLYAAAIVLVSFLSWLRRRIPLTYRPTMAAAIMIMHISWGAGFVSQLGRRRDRRTAP